MGDYSCDADVNVSTIDGDPRAPWRVLKFTSVDGDQRSPWSSSPPSTMRVSTP